MTLQVGDGERWQQNKPTASERILRGTLVKKLEAIGHTNVEPICDKKITGPDHDGFSREVDAAAIAGDCAMVAEHKNVMDEAGALQLVSLITSIE